jgi:hypothetical protein
MIKLLDRRIPLAVAASALLAAPAAYGAHASSQLVAPGRVILGSDVLQPQHDSLIAGRAEAFRLRAHDSGLAAQARIYIDRKSTARTLLIGLYDDANGHPGSLLSAGSVSALEGGSWTTVALAPTRLASAGTYWLTILGEGGTLRFRDRHRARCRSEKNAEASLNRLPASWRMGRAHARIHCAVSAYVLEATGAAASPISLGALPGPTSAPGLTSPTVPTPPAEAPPVVKALPPHAPTNTTPPSIGGTPTEGDTLTATSGTWTGGPTYAYQWQDCETSGKKTCTNVAVHATSSSYTLVKSDVGREVRVEVKATNAGGSASATSTPTSKAVAAAKVKPPPPANTALPVISGTTTQGQKLSSTTGSWSGSPTGYAYQWEACESSGKHEGCTDISEATASSYTLLSSDVGHTLRVVVSATNAGGSTSSTSAATAVVGAPASPPPVNTAVPTVSGTTTQGQVLSSTTGSWSGSPASYDYQWQDCETSGKNCSNVSGATSSTYTLAESDAGHKLRVVVTATNAGGMTPADSAATAAVVLPLSPANTALPVIGGTATEGNTLSVTTGSWSHKPTSYAYQWETCNSAGGACSSVSGATSSSYTLGASDVAHTMRVIVTATNAGGSSTPATSAQTAEVSVPAEGTPPVEGAPYPACTTTLSAGANVASAVSSASGGSVICLNSGAYGKLTLNAEPSSNVTLQAAPSAHVTATGVNISGSHLVIRGLWISGEVELEEGASFITIDHNDISEGGEGIVFNTSDCKAPNAPEWAGCEPDAQITNVVISGNHIHDIGQPGTEDAIHLDYWRNVTVTGNEFDHIIESGNHTDCLQSVYGGSELTFTHNYEHDDDCQGFFVKDGDASDVSFTENLLLRDNEPDGKGEHFGNLAQFWNIQGLTIEHNTDWDGKGIVLVAEDAQNSPSATIDHNLFSYFSISKAIGTPYAITESYDIFEEAPETLDRSSTDSIDSKPQFDDTATDDYRLASNPNGIGIDWSPAEMQYGPID